MIQIYYLDTAILKQDQGYDKYNQSLGPPTETNIKCFHEEKTHLVNDINGEKVLSSGNIRIDYNPDITHEYTIEVKGREHEIVSIAHPKNFTEKITRIYLK
jgi:hypothetical protein